MNEISSKKITWNTRLEFLLKTRIKEDKWYTYSDSHGKQYYFVARFFQYAT